MQEKSACCFVSAREREFDCLALAIILRKRATLARGAAQQVQIKHAASESSDAGRTNRAGDGKTP